MSIGRILVAAVLPILLVASAGRATPEEDRCKAAIQSRGTALFVTELDTLRRCKSAELLPSDDPSGEGCPSESGAARIATAASRTTAALDANCTVSNAQFSPCVLAAASESSDVAFGIFGAAPIPEPDKTRRGCRAALGRETGRFATFKAKKLAACNTRFLGGVAGSGPSGEACDDPAGTQAAIAAAQVRLEEKLGRECGGPDRVAGTADDPDPQDDIGFGTVCPVQPYCALPIDTVPDLVACMTCIASSEVDQVSRGLAALPLGASAACLLGLDKAIVSIVDEALRDLSDCEEAVLRGTELPPCPNFETQNDLVDSAVRFQSAVTAACGVVEAIPAWALQDIAATLVAMAYQPHAEETNSGRRNCKLAIGDFTESTSGYTRRIIDAHATCRLLSGCGQTSAPCPDAEASASIARAMASTPDRIHQRCDDYLPSELGFGDTCQGFAPCLGLPTTTIDELITCLRCSADQAVDLLPLLAVLPP